VAAAAVATAHLMLLALVAPVLLFSNTQILILQQLALALPEQPLRLLADSKLVPLLPVLAIFRGHFLLL
jgi:hypothetical protein